jgi:hypothetical protein
MSPEKPTRVGIDKDGKVVVAPIFTDKDRQDVITEGIAKATMDRHLSGGKVSDQEVVDAVNDAHEATVRVEADYENTAFDAILKEFKKDHPGVDKPETIVRMMIEKSWNDEMGNASDNERIKDSIVSANTQELLNLRLDKLSKEGGVRFSHKEKTSSSDLITARAVAQEVVGILASSKQDPTSMADSKARMDARIKEYLENNR